MQVKEKKLPKSQIELTFELTADEFKQHADHALGHLKHHVKVDGFRPGKAPDKMVEDKIKPEALLMEAGEHAVQHVYSDYVRENKLEAVGHPEVKIVKIAQGSPFVFTATVTILPDVELPDYKKIAAAVNPSGQEGQKIEVTEEEIQDSLNYLQKSRAKMTLKNDVAVVKDFVEIEYSCKDIENGKLIKDQFILGEGGFMKGFEDSIAGMKAGEEKTFTVKFPEKSPLAGKDGEFKVRVVSVNKMELPEINDELVKQMGAFDTLVALKASMKEGLTAEKRDQEKQRVRAEILNKIAEKAKFETPESMIDYEQQRLLEDLKNRITTTIKNITFEQYLASIKKTEQEIKETYKKEAEKRLRGFLVLRQLGKQEKVEVSEKEVEEEVEKALKSQPKPFDVAQGKFDINELKEYTKGVITNEKIFQILEKFSQ